MIDINLIPPEKGRRRKKKGFFPAGFVLPREVIIGLSGGFLVLLAVGHIVLQAFIMVKYAQLRQQQKDWQEVLPEKQEVDAVMKALQKRQLRLNSINDIRGASGVFWAGKLNMLSNALPRGVWLRDVLLENADFMINGSSVSKHKMEKLNVYNFVKKLKESRVLMEGVISMEVESVKNRQIGETTVADFIIRMVLEKEEEKEQDNQKSGKKKKRTRKEKP